MATGLAVGALDVMNAVNLIPGDRRKRTSASPSSPLTLGVIGGLVVVLVAAVLYVFAVNDVRARKSELARVTANAASWQAAANSYASYVTAAQQHKQQLADVHQLVTGRFPWSMLLSQIGGVMPANAALSSLQAYLALGGFHRGRRSGHACWRHAHRHDLDDAGRPDRRLRREPVGCRRDDGRAGPGPRRGIGLAGVDDEQHRRRATSSGSSSSSSSIVHDGGCPFPVNFTLSLVLAPSASATGTPGSATPTSSTAAATATPTASTAATRQQEAPNDPAQT